jgi:hypothetical protein
MGIVYRSRERLLEMMWYKHRVCHALWALLYSKWKLEIATRQASESCSYSAEEAELKKRYRESHGELAPLMLR